MELVMEILNRVGADMMNNPTIVLGLLVAVVLMVLSVDFRNTVFGMVNQAIGLAEAELDKVGKEKLDMAVDLVMALLPQPYRTLLPRAMVVTLVQFVFNRKWAMVLDKSAVKEVAPPKQ